MSPTNSSISMQRPDNVDEADWSALQNEFNRIGTTQMTPDQLYNAKPEQLGNDPAIELQWAMKAGKHADTYMNMLKIYKDKSKLKLTPIDSDIYTHFRSIFPHTKVDVLPDNHIQSEKDKWNKFVEHYKDNDKINDYKFGSILRKSVHLPLDSDNSIIVARMIFIAIEVARNKEGYNNHIQ